MIIWLDVTGDRVWDESVPKPLKVTPVAVDSPKVEQIVNTISVNPDDLALGRRVCLPPSLDTVFLTFTVNCSLDERLDIVLAQLDRSLSHFGWT